MTDNIQRIYAYKTPDGKVFQQEADAELHLELINRKSALEAWCEHHLFHNIRADELADIMFENRGTLLQALQ